MRNHGVDPATRGQLVDEQLAALKAIWTRDEAEFHGTYVDFDPIYSWPKPVQQPHPPIYLGGESPAALRRLVRYGDAWLPRAHIPPDEIRRVRKWLADQGRGNIPVTVFSAPPDPDLLRGYAEAGVEEVTLELDTLPEPDTLRALDALAQVADAHR
jgi:alkanesulfonate monooxygenase SsuD/methylene tetrahydromethanopterin reductase-like flavin-dependent oxidoreductase (luciferase family)